MTVQQIIDSKKFEVISVGESTEMEVQDIFCCDLLSIAMSKAPAGAAWVTVMGNVNTIAVATLAEVSAVIIAEGMAVDAFALEKAKEQGIIVLATRSPIFETANWIYRRLYE